VNATASLWIPTKLRTNLSSLWLAPFFHLTSLPSSLTWSSTELLWLTCLLPQHKVFSHFKVLHSIASASWDAEPLQRVPLPAAQSFYPSHSFICLPDVISLPLRYTEKYVEVYHRSTCRVISGCLTSTPIPVLLLESLPPLKIVLNHQSPCAHLLRMGPSPPCRQTFPTALARLKTSQLYCPTQLAQSL